MTESKIIHLKTGENIQILDVYPDYLTDKKYVVYRHQNQIYISDYEQLKLHAQPLDPKKEHRTTTNKIKLYRQYFRGDDNKVALSFENNEKKRVYYVWCNLRKKYPCPKIKSPSFKCSECKFQQFQPLNDQIIFEHLKGKNQYGKEAFYGIYPIREDNTVYFLAFDFDKHNWKEIVKALVKTCQKFKLSPLLELSQSGNGCHVWIFFQEAISAKKARQLGDALLKYTMQNYPQLNFDAFDRLFPSQDERSIAGFGNLIALPLQGEKVRHGKSRFIDNHFEIIEDIWGTLENTPKINETQVDEVIQNIQTILPIQFYKEEAQSQEMNLFQINEESHSYNNNIEITASNELILNIKDLPKPALVQLKYLSSFINKNYYIKQRKRLSTHDTPRIIGLAKISDQQLRLPRGLLSNVCQLLPNATVKEDYNQVVPLNVQFSGTLYPEQQIAFEKLKDTQSGILCAGTGFGKTVVAAKLIAVKQARTLVLVNNKNLAKQWKNAIKQFLVIKNAEQKEVKNFVGELYGGKDNLKGMIDIALFQSLNKREDLPELLQNYEMVIVDEAHHISAKTFEDIVSQSKSRYIYGLTATPHREDHLENILFMRIGPIIHTADKIVPKHISQQLYLRFTSCGEHLSTIEQQSLHQNYQMILENETRNQIIIQDIVACIKQNRHLIVLSRYVKHIKQLNELLYKIEPTIPIYMLNGKMKAKDLQIELGKLKQEGRPFVLFTTGSYAGEGFDLPALDTLMLTMPISGKTSLQQYLGRLLRNLDEKEKLYVFDYVDYAIPMMYRMYQKRLSYYRKAGYSIMTDIHSNQYKSELITQNHQEIFENDILHCRQVHFIYSYLSQSEAAWLVELSKKKEIQIVLLLDKKIANQPHLQSSLANIETNGGQCIYLEKIRQRMAILDKKISWLLPDTNQEEIALRLISPEIAQNFLKYFLQ